MGVEVGACLHLVDCPPAAVGIAQKTQVGMGGGRGHARLHKRPPLPPIPRARLHQLLQASTPLLHAGPLVEPPRVNHLARHLNLLALDLVPARTRGKGEGEHSTAAGGRAPLSVPYPTPTTSTTFAGSHSTTPPVPAPAPPKERERAGAHLTTLSMLSAYSTRPSGAAGGRRPAARCAHTTASATASRCSTRTSRLWPMRWELRRFK